MMAPDLNFDRPELEDRLRDQIRIGAINSPTKKQHILDLALWAHGLIHGTAVPSPTLRKRMVGSSLTLCIDLYQSTASLAIIGGSAAISVLARSVVESYALGFWLAHVASDSVIDQYAAGHETKTLKPLLKAIYKSPHASRSRLAITTDDASMLDSITHGGIRQMMLRNINGPTLGSAKNRGLDLSAVLIGAQMCVFSVETYIRELLEDEAHSLKAFEQGHALINRIILE